MDIKEILGFLNTIMGILKKIFAAIGIDALSEMF